MLKVENVILKINKDSPLERTLFNSLNLTVKKGEFIALIGGNGTGKSTLLNIISGNIKPDAGKVLFENREISQKSSLINSKEISRVVQDPKIGTIEQMTLEENLSFALNRGKIRTLKFYKTKERKSFFSDKLSCLEMGLENRLDDLVLNLSGGQRQALSLIMAILSDSKLLLLDEITAALDPKSAEQVLKIANKVILQEGLSAIMITHNMHEAIRYGSRIVILKQGTIVKEYGGTQKNQLTPQQLIENL